MMPYIEDNRRGEIAIESRAYRGGLIDPPEEASLIIVGHEIRNAGELNYAITKLIMFYLNETMGHRYQYFCEIEGVLSHVAKELYRRVTSIYEDEKIAENGDVFK